MAATTQHREPEHDPAPSGPAGGRRQSRWLKAEVLDCLRTVQRRGPTPWTTVDSGSDTQELLVVVAHVDRVGAREQSQDLDVRRGV